MATPVDAAHEQPTALSIPRLVVTAQNLLSEVERLRQGLAAATRDAEASRNAYQVLEAEMRQQRAAARQQATDLQEEVARLQRQHETAAVAQREKASVAEHYRLEREALLEARDGAGSNLAAEVQRSANQLQAKEAEICMIKTQLDTQTLLVEALDKELADLRKKLTEVRAVVQGHEEAVKAHCERVQKQIVDEKHLISRLESAAAEKKEAEQATDLAKGLAEKLQGDVAELQQKLQVAEDSVLLHKDLLARRDAKLDTEVAEKQKLLVGFKRSEDLLMESARVQQRQQARITQLEGKVRQQQLEAAAAAAAATAAVDAPQQQQQQQKQLLPAAAAASPRCSQAALLPPAACAAGEEAPPSSPSGPRCTPNRPSNSPFPPLEQAATPPRPPVNMIDSAGQEPADATPRSSGSKRDRASLPPASPSRHVADAASCEKAGCGEDAGGHQDPLGCSSDDQADKRARVQLTADVETRVQEDLAAAATAGISETATPAATEAAGPGLVPTQKLPGSKSSWPKSVIEDIFAAFSQI